MMRSCRQVSELLSARLDRKLSLMEGLGLRFHLAMCKACSRVAQQLELLRTGAADLPGLDEGKGPRGR
jgi:predicted anti-sigma-YlaC factor YlaD